MDRATSFTRLMARLPDWRIVAYDRRGYASSSHIPAGETFDAQVEDLLEVLDGAPAVAFGHSFGGDVVLAAAAAHPSLIPSALVWEPPQPWLPWWPAAVGSPGSETNSSTQGDHREPDPADEAEAFMRRMVGDRVSGQTPLLHPCRPSGGRQDAGGGVGQPRDGPGL